MQKFKIIKRFSSSVVQFPSCDFVPTQFNTKLDESEIYRIHKQNLSPVLKRYYEKPVILTQGHKQFVWDHTGKRYLDIFGGIVTTSVGHCHPKLVQVAQKQLEKLWHTSSLYHTEEINEYTSKLLRKFPPHLNNVFFVNSGSEATELAILLARLHTKSNVVLCLQNAYHGCSSTGLSTIGISSWKYNVHTQQDIFHVPNPNPYGGRFGDSTCRDHLNNDSLLDCNCKPLEKSEFDVKCAATEEYLKDMQSVIDSVVPKGKLAAFMVESIQGVGGTVQYPKEYLFAAQKLVKAQNGLLISDEVQTGFGRTGKNFWGFENHRISPDIVTMAKGIANGFPMAAVVTSKEIASSLSSAQFFNTYGGNPLACRIASTVLDIIEEEKLQLNSLEVGNYFFNELDNLRRKHSNVVGDVRGLGLMLGVEMKDPKGKQAHLEKEPMDLIMEKCMQKQLLIGRGGSFGNVLRIKPPMCISKQDVDYSIATLDAVFTDLFK